MINQKVDKFRSGAEKWRDTGAVFIKIGYAFVAFK